MIIARILSSGFICSLCAAAALAQTRGDIDQARSAQRAATAAFKAGRLDEYRAAAQKVNALRPDYPGGIYQLAQAYARAGETDAALAQLELLARMGLEFAPAEDTAFQRLSTVERFRAIAERERSNKKPLNRALVSDSFGGSSFHPDGIAYDAAQRRFCIGSVRERRVTCKASNGSLQDYGVTANLWSVLGLAFAPNGHLWLATTALPEMSGYTSDLRGRTALVEIDAAKDAVIRRIGPPADSLEHSFGDVTVAPDGTVYLSDGAGTLYRLNGDLLEPVGAPRSWVSPQGIASTPDGKQLFVADYSRGVFLVDVQSGTTTQLPAPAETTLLGIDGLTYHNGSLIAIQNGIRPYRVARLRLDAKAARIASVEILEASHAFFDEPTTGVVVGDRYFFIANSHWPTFANGQTPPGPVTQPIILTLPLR